MFIEKEKKREKKSLITTSIEKKHGDRTYTIGNMD